MALGPRFALPLPIVRAFNPAFALMVSLILVIGVATPAAADELLTKVNAVRSNDLTSLAAAETLAQRSASSQAAAGQLAHTSLNSLLDECDAAGEVVGAGPSIVAIFDAFRDSPTHWNIITGANWTSAGTGVAVADDGTLYVSVVFCHEIGGAHQTPTTTAPTTATTAPPPKPTTRQRKTAVRPVLAEPLLLAPCSLDRDLVLHEPPWETGGCPGVA